MTHTLYLYTTKSQQKKSVAADGEIFPVRIKVGQTGLSADVRIAQQDGTGNSEPLVKIKEFTNVPSHITDKVLHGALGRKGYVKSREGEASREWFNFPLCDTADEAKKIVTETLNGLIHGKESLFDWAALSYQQAIVDWSVEAFKTRHDILINAIMRAGKCFISYEIARSLGAKKILVVTAKPKVNESWAALLPGGDESHVNYSDWKYHNYKEYIKDNTLVLSAEADVVFVSLQFINKHIDNPNKLMKSILKQHWDLIIFDEQHYATITDNTQHIWDILSFDRKVELSGTPYKTILSGRYDQNSSYNFDYVTEQQLRRNSQLTPDSSEAEAFKYRADINYAMVNIPDKVKQLLGEDGFTFSKLFATTDGVFNNVVAVNEYLTFVASTYKKPPNRFKAVADKVCRHTLWLMPPDIAAINAMAKLLKSNAFFGKRKIINASGGRTKTIDAVKKIITQVDTDPNQKQQGGTITLSCGTFREGASIPKWWSVHQMNNGMSASDYFQGSFRCKTPWVDGQKESVIVFDYAPERFVNVVYQHCEQVSLIENRPVSTIISEWLDVSEVYDYVGNTWNVLTGEDISTRFLADINNHMDRISNAITKSGIDATIIALMTTKKKDAKQQGTVTSLNVNNTLMGTNKKRLNNSSKKAKNEADDEEDTVQRIRYALKQLFKLIDVSWADNIKISTIDDIVSYKDIIVLDVITGLCPAEWKQIMPAINTTIINRAIGQYNDFQ